MTAQRIGEWDFDKESGELTRGRDRRRLEPRAARTLELLCDAQGGLVSQERLIAEVWDGRSLSENSVPVVISQLRRVLGDDARKPMLIETVPKRGYRLVHAERKRSKSLRPVGVVLVAFFAILALGALAFAVRADTRPVLVVADVVNATGDESFTPLARATSELVIADLAQRGFQVRRQGPGDMQLSMKLVMWNGQPSLGLTATDRSGVVRWSAMTSGRAEQVPTAVKAELDEFQAKLSPSQSN